MTSAPPSGDQLLGVLAALANPHRLRIVAALHRQPDYVSRLARALGLSRALLQLHLKKLEAAGLVTGRLELSDDGKAMKFYEVTPFAYPLTPELVARATPSLTTPAPADAGDEAQEAQ